ncbi:MAG: zinc ribbon domain-containing protein [Butyrivibrio sp.]|nr:zinc ribbon domain-containing protein [Acetatifactor muris]MCM1559128.1 zinc ribbon domain-containing protein [Butyrivibrio sp.]
MFCSKCGALIAEGAGFCQKCGNKVVSGDKGEAADSQPAQASQQAYDMAGFKAFVDKHVRETTKFQSAEDILNHSKPWLFIWICVGVLAVFGLILAGPLGLLLFGGFFGYCAVFIAGGIIRNSCRRKFSGKTDVVIDTENFIQFLNDNMRYVSPYFHQWGYVTAKGGLLAHIEKAASQAVGEITLGCAFGPKEKNLAVLIVRPDRTDPSSGQMQYFVNAEHSGFLIDGRMSGMLSHSCLIKTAPILQAAVLYYVNVVKNL